MTKCSCTNTIDHPRKIYFKLMHISHIIHMYKTLKHPKSGPFIPDCLATSLFYTTADISYSFSYLHSVPTIPVCYRNSQSDSFWLMEYQFESQTNCQSFPRMQATLQKRISNAHLWLGLYSAWIVFQSVLLGDGCTLLLHFF